MKKLTMLTTEFDSIGRHVKPKFDSRLGHHVKNDKRGACKHKAATVLPNRTTATYFIYSSLSSFEFDIV